MKELDLSSVPPMRWQEVRRRVSAIRDYLDLHQPIVSDRESAAEKVGLSLDQFERLIRSWRIHADPARLDGAGSLSRTRRERSDGLAPEVHRIIDSAICMAGPEGAPGEIYAMICAECEASGVECPSNNLVWGRIMTARSKATAMEDGPVETLVGRIWIHLPVLTGAKHGGVHRPELLVAVKMPERNIVAYQSDIATGRPPVFEDIDRTSITTHPIHVAPRDVSDIETFGLPEVEKDGRANTRVARILGNSIGGLDIAFRLPRKPAAALFKNKLDAALTSMDAQLAIAYAIRRHNERLGIDLASREPVQK